MVLGEWWLRHGPGSPGAIARAMAKACIRIKSANPEMSRPDLLHATLLSRYQVAPGLDEAEAAEMLSEAGTSLSKLTVQVWRRENPRVLGAVSNAPDVYSQGVQIIGEETRKIAPDVA